MSQAIEALSAHFQHPGLEFQLGSGGFVKAVVNTEVSTGEVYLHGAHVTAFQLNGQPPLLWMSERSLFETGKAIRGGVPICFPWFGPLASDPKAPGHGFARVKVWDIATAYPSDDGGLAIDLQTTIDDYTLTYTVAFGRTLQLTLKVDLSPSASGLAKFEEALHTYLSVSDVRNVTIEGLESTGFVDKVDGGKRKPATGESIRFSSECDRVYLDTTATCVLRDPGFNRSIAVSKSASRSTVVWNPWIEKSIKMADFGDNEWPTMLCIETANVGSNSIELEPGQSHTLTAQVAVLT